MQSNYTLAPRRKSKKADSLRHHAVIILADIVDYSEIPSIETQNKVVKRLWAHLKNDPLTKRNGASTLKVNGTGDGALLVFPEGSRLIPHSKFVDFAEKWINHMRNGNPSVELRIGIHTGPFSELKISFSSKKHSELAGTGINDCARVCAIGDEGHIMMSEAFVGNWTDVNRTQASEYITNLNTDPHTHLAKHDRKISVRVYKVPSTLPDPVAFKRKQSALHLLLQQLEDIEGKLISGLRSAGLATITKESLDARFTVLEHRNKDSKEYLTATFPRYHHSYPQGQNIGGTEYPLSQDGHGPPARAYRSARVVVDSNLPDYKNQKSLYNKRMLHTWGLKRDIIKKFSRHARSYIDIPFMNYGDHGSVGGVICIDCMHPLASVEQSRLIQIAELIKNQKEEIISCLVKLST